MQPRMRALHDHNITAYEQLYQDSVRRLARHEEYQHWVPEEATFQPQLLSQSAGSTSWQAHHREAANAQSPVTSSFKVLAPKQPGECAHERLYACRKRQEVCSDTCAVMG